MNILQFVLDRTFIQNSFPFRVILLSGLQYITQFKSSGGDFLIFFKLSFSPPFWRSPTTHGGHGKQNSEAVLAFL